MEREGWNLPAIGWEDIDLPDWSDLRIEGVCEDAAGKSQPIHAFGTEPSPITPVEVEEPKDEVEMEHLFNVSEDTLARHALKLVRRAVKYSRDPDVDVAVAWMRFWQEAPRGGRDERDFETGCSVSGVVRASRTKSFVDKDGSEPFRQFLH